jgi:hypothetical protein
MALSSDGKGKRGADEPLAGTSSSSSDEDSPRIIKPATPNLTHLQEDCGYYSSQSSSSPANCMPSLTLPQQGIAIQPVNQAVRRPKLKKQKPDGVILVGEAAIGSTPRTKHTRDPMPMRMRSLPQSFWQQPNLPQSVSPATVYPVLPPLISKEGHDVSDLRPVTPPEERQEREDREKEKQKEEKYSYATNEVRHYNRRQPERTITVTNTDLLTKLFEVVEKDPLKGRRFKSRSKPGPKPVMNHQSQSKFVTGQDPYMVDCIAEQLFPQLSLEHRKAAYTMYNTGNSTLAVYTIKEGDRTVTLPQLTVDHNYPQMLSELVMHF